MVKQLPNHSLEEILMTSNDNGKNAFTSDEATKIICTALTNGSLVLPLNKKLQDLGLVQFVKL